jgi:hypothetical protein
MPARDPLAVLARLRRIETDRARRLLGDRLARTAEAEARAVAASDRLGRERAAAAAMPADLGAWLARGLAARDRAAAALAQAAATEATARDALAAARAAECAVETLRAARRVAAAREAARGVQAALDDRTAGRWQRR